MDILNVQIEREHCFVSTATQQVEIPFPDHRQTPSQLYKSYFQNLLTEGEGNALVLRFNGIGSLQNFPWELMGDGKYHLALQRPLLRQIIPAPSISRLSN